MEILKSFTLIATACFVASFACGLVFRLFIDSKIKDLKDKIKDKDLVIKSLQNFISIKKD
tara:strand:+ start:352 stop:531 length:180 start_codon:yes stop_codon:yes gene_type:complete